LWQFLRWRSDRVATPAEWGRRAEHAAAAYLARRGLRLVEKNYRTRAGEIDLVMTHGCELVFVEVRLRSRNDFGDGAATVDYNKQRRLIRAAESFLQHRTSNAAPCRFDVVSVARTGYRLRFEWIRNAFTP
jgi:putative endonuclease